MMRLIRFAAATIAATACAPRIAPVVTQPPVNTAELPIVSDAAADTLLADVRTLAPGIVVELRYATSNNFTGVPIPGYEGNHAYVRRGAALDLARVENSFASRGLGLKIDDAYGPGRSTLAVVE